MFGNKGALGFESKDSSIRLMWTNWKRIESHHRIRFTCMTEGHGGKETLTLLGGKKNQTRSLSCHLGSSPRPRLMMKKAIFISQGDHNFSNSNLEAKRDFYCHSENPHSWDFNQSFTLPWQRWLFIKITKRKRCEERHQTFLVTIFLMLSSSTMVIWYNTSLRHNWDWMSFVQSVFVLCSELGRLISGLDANQTSLWYHFTNNHQF